LSDKKDLWEMVRREISDSEPESKIETPNIICAEEIVKEKIEKKPEIELKKESEETIEKNTFNDDFAATHLLKEGVFAGFLYIFGIMIVLGVLSIPGSITAAIGGFFGGKKAGDPGRALTAAMLPFLVIAAIYFLASSGALPPGSGPNDVATEIGELIEHSPADDSLGPISKMPDSTSSVFISVVTFAFIGGLANIDNNNKKNIS
jgi:hypothetical protein